MKLINPKKQNGMLHFIMLISSLLFFFSCQSNEEKQDELVELERSCTVDPVFLTGANNGGNVTCEEVGAYFGVTFNHTSGKIDDGTRCGGSAGGFTWTTDPTCTYLNWEWTGPGDPPCHIAIIMKGGDGANVYYYDNSGGAGCTSSTGLHSPTNGGGQIAALSNVTFCYDDPCPPPPPTTCNDETAFGGNVAGAGKAWWFYLDARTYPVTADIIAGQNQIAGTVTYNPDLITISLNAGWSLDLTNLDSSGLPVANTEPVKIQGYNVLPSKRPSAGLFTTYKGTSTSVMVPKYPYYVVHLDLTYCE